MRDIHRVLLCFPLFNSVYIRLTYGFSSLELVNRSTRRSTTQLYSLDSKYNDKTVHQRNKNRLLASSLDTDFKPNSRPVFKQVDFVETKSLQGRIMSTSPLKVLSASFLITANTVGPSMLILPEYAQGPGMLISCGLFAVIYIINLLSGLLIAEVAINQYETSNNESSSSFKEFSNMGIKSKEFGDVVAFLSIFINGAVLAYDLVLVGEVIASNYNIGYYLQSIPNFGLSSVSSIVAGMILIAVTASQTNTVLSYLASFCSTILFTSFAGLIAPGLSSIDEPLMVLSAAGRSSLGSSSFFHDVTIFLPILMTTLVYQNIVPSVAKLLGYDRKKTTIAISLGSFIPMLMCTTYCFVILGAGLDHRSSGVDFHHWFTMSSLIGSSVACVISMAEEFKSYMGKEERTVEGKVISTYTDRNSFPTVVLSVGPALVIGLIFSGEEGFTEALRIAGSYACPILYGLVPCILAISRARGSNETGTRNLAKLKIENQMTISVVGVSFMAFILQQLLNDCQSLLD